MIKISMDRAKEDHRMKYVENLAAIGAATDLCEFLADILQCESDMMHTTGKYLVEINDQISKRQRIDDLVSILQRIYKSILAWKERIDDLEARKAGMPQDLDVDRSKLGQVRSFKAICSLETSKTSLREGENVEITDLSHPGLIKVRNADGKEGYLPLLSCFVPTPDLDIGNCTERLRIQLMTCTSDLMGKLQGSLIKNLLTALEDLIAYLDITFPLASNKAVIHKFKDRARSCMVNFQEGQFHLKHLARCLRSLENDFIRNSVEDAEEVCRKIATMDKAILFFLAIRDKLVAYRAEMKAGFRPIRITRLDAETLNFYRNKPIRYYEVRVISEETAIREERTYFPPTKVRSDEATSGTDSLRNMKSGSSKRCSVQSVVDPRSGIEISIKEAVALGILDHRSSRYVDLLTGEKISMSTAISKGLIKVSRKVEVDGSECDENANKIKSLVSDDNSVLGMDHRMELSPSEGLVILKTKVMKAEYEILAAIDRANGHRLSAREATDLGILRDGLFHDTKTGSVISLEEAVCLGLVEVKGWKRESGESRSQTPPYDERAETFAVEGVYDSSTKCYISFLEAVKRHMVDPCTGCIIDAATNDKVFPREAIDRGLIKVRPVEPRSSLQVYRGSFGPTQVPPLSSAHRYLRTSPTSLENSANYFNRHHNL